MLYIVATPIGNLGDITVRALEVLRSVNLIACEDTRRTRILLDHYGIRTPTTSYFQHNRVVKGAYLVKRLREGEHIALVSDAGTPGILDPGYNLIREVIQEGIPVTCIPGPSAFLAAIVLSGKPAYTFCFAGFLPPRPGARRNRLKELCALGVTVVCYESCHRIAKTLIDLHEVDGKREIVLCRELTKKFEEVKRGRAQDVLKGVSGIAAKGEFVLVF